MTTSTLIVARIAPDSDEAVAELFRRSDATSLPLDLGVRRRLLYRYHGLYFHHIDFDREPGPAIEQARGRADFRELSDALDAYISPYDPVTWRSPADAAAVSFYSWTRDGEDR